MKGKYIGIVALLLAASSTVACGSDDDGGGDGAAALTSCNAYCDAAVAKSCTDSADCKSFECSDLDKATGPCATEFKRYYDCMKAQADVCAQTCTPDLAKCG
ncbi:MAG TPA: hypothetical protein VEX18_01645 [Polyangiaceae bacterium]|nr:hypothetical protein [Polyangiaceae bacterium]